MAISEVDVTIPHRDELFLASEWTTPSSDRRVDVISPTTGHVIASLPEVTTEDADVAVRGARAAFPAWSQSTLQERYAVVRLDVIKALWAEEGGMPVQTGEAFAMATRLIAEDVLGIAQTLELSEIRDTPAGKVEIRHEPIGPTLAILTYNGPHVESAMSVLPGLLAGNTFVVKVAPESRIVGYLMADAADQAGFPAGVLSIFAGEAEVSKFLVNHPDIDAIHFTGGTEIGADIVRASAGRIAKVTLELGGKSAAIIADDADLDTAIPALVGAMTGYCGQICVAMTRILVSHQRHDEVVDRLKQAFAALRIGDPADPQTDYGPLVAERVRERAEGYIERAVQDGATIAYGGQRPSGHGDGWFLEPTLLTNVDNSMEVAQNEIFGPVFCVIPYDDIDNAVDIANDSRFGLCGSVFSRDSDLARDVARRVRTGTFAVNGASPCLTAPFGGMKQSGFGRESGRESILELTSMKAIALYD